MIWQFRPIDRFPPRWAEVIRRGEGILAFSQTRRGIENLQQQWQHFRYCLRYASETELGKLFAKRDWRARIIYSDEWEAWTLQLQSREKIDDVFAQSSSIGLDKLDAPADNESSRAVPRQPPESN